MTETPTPAPLPNDPAARAPDGQILNQSTITPETPTQASTSSTPPPTGTTNEPDPSAPKPDADTAPKVPESYALKTSDGKPVDETLLASATPIFKELGLDNTAAQKLVDLYNTNMKVAVDASAKTIVDQANTWLAEVKAHPVLGPNEDRVRTELMRGLEAVCTPEEKAALIKFQDQTFLFNNPAVLLPLWKLAQRAAPGTPVNGAGPSPHGQSRTGENSRPSIAAALYPNLKSRAS